MISTITIALYWTEVRISTLVIWLSAHEFSISLNEKLCMSHV